MQHLQVVRQFGRHRRLADVDAQKALLAVLDELRRQCVTNVVHQHADGGDHDRPLPCKCHAARQALAIIRVQRRFGLQALQRGQDGIGVAVDVGPDLQHRDSAIATGERGQQGTRWQRRHIHRSPGDALEAQGSADLFREGRERVVVKNDVGQGISDHDDAFGKKGSRETLKRVGPSASRWRFRRRRGRVRSGCGSRPGRTRRRRVPGTRPPTFRDARGRTKRRTGADRTRRP
ncbi:hypothetical protein J518_4111 [Acinetobacter baumannii 1419130]|nr:hypothetical protein J518_4111 [Acinetobacter baumannii 1419130]